MVTLDPTIGLGSLITLAVMLIGGVGGYYTLQAIVATMGDRLEKMAVRSEAESTKHGTHHDENQKRMAAIELQIARECVKIEDFRRLDDRMTTRFEKMEHAINNSAMKTAQIVKDALRDMLPNKGDRP